MKGLDTVAQVYASSLLEIAFSKGVPGEVLRDIEEIGRILKKEPRVLAFLITPNIKKDAKRQVIDRAFGGRVAEVVQNFLKVVVDKGRAVALPEIIRAFVASYHERQGELVVNVRSAHPLDDDERDRIRAALKKKYAGQWNEFLLEERVDPALLGGLVLRTGDNVYDASLRTRLTAIGDRLRASRFKNEETYED
jgi:F-type H+-transporting ATPase subunit delta